MRRKNFARIAILLLALASAASLLLLAQSNSDNKLLTGQAAFGGYKDDRPGLRRKITVSDLPKPYATPSVDRGPDVVARPADARPQTLSGFKVDLYADNLENPRLIRTAPNGDYFLSESQAGELKVLRGVDGKGRAQQVTVFAKGLNKPFGIAFYPQGSDPQWVYVANTDAVVRIPYRNGDTQARGKAEHIVDLPGGGRLRGGGHWTRDIALSPDGKKMWVSVGSHSNADDVDTTPREKNRADILEFNLDGSGMRVYAAGIRNPVGIALHPTTGQLWTSVNERDGLGDDLVPDYITHVQDGGFYGWPWYYVGGHQDPRLQDKHPDLRKRMITPDVLVQAHSASLQMTFYDGKHFPAEYHGHAFAAQHGSWNRTVPTGYKVIRVPVDDKGKANGEYQDFVTGFVTADGRVWGRPVGVTVGKDGSLLISDDGSNSIWRVTYVGK